MKNPPSIGAPDNKVRLSTLFGVFAKIGAFTFGGGYAMIALISKESVEKRKWLNESEFLDLIAIAESTPGPIAVNSATYLGYKLRGFWGSFFATLGVVLPSFVVIVILSYFLEAFRHLTWVGYAFQGIAAGVAVLIINAALKLFKSVPKNWLSFVLIVFGFILAVTDLIPTPLVILSGGILGFLIHLSSRRKSGESL
ncbi:MAG TPA: chromate transporter [Candidatus Izemoplasmatales bacterium]|nr:chromate transporter [Candidatus Izemoplasmatales bacterium]